MRRVVTAAQVGERQRAKAGCREDRDVVVLSPQDLDDKPFCSVRKVVAIVFGVGVCHDRVCDDEKGGTSRVLVLFVVAES